MNEGIVVLGFMKEIFSLARKHFWILLKRNRSWQVPNPLFNEDPLYCLPPISNFVQPPTSSLFLLSCCFGWMCHYATSNVLFCLIMDLNLLSLGTLVLAAPCCMFYATRHQTYWRFDTNNPVLWFDTIHPSPPLPLPPVSLGGEGLGDFRRWAGRGVGMK